MQNQNIPGKPARHQGFSPPFSCWQPPAIGDTLNHLGADWSLKRRSKNETRYHRDQATTGHCILKNPPGCLIIACLLIANLQWLSSHKTVDQSTTYTCLVIRFLLFLLRIDSVHSHSCHKNSQKVFFLPLPTTRAAPQSITLLYISTQNNTKKGAKACLAKEGGTFEGRKIWFCDFGHNFWIVFCIHAENSACENEILFWGLEVRNFSMGKKRTFQ